MRPIAHYFQDRETWLEARKKFVGGSDVSALAGLSAYQSELGLYLEKSGQLEPADISTEPHVMRGNHLESGIAEYAAELEGWKIIQTKDWAKETGALRKRAKP